MRSLRHIRADRLSPILSALLLTACGTPAPGPNTLDPDLQAIADDLTEKLGPVVKVGKSAAAQFGRFVSQGGDPVAALINWANAQPEVQNAQRSIDGMTVVIRLDNGETVGVMTDGKDRPEWSLANTARRINADHTQPGLDTSAAQSPWNKDAARDRTNCDPRSYPSSRKAFLAAMYQQDFGQDIENIARPLRGSGYTVDIFAIRSVAGIDVLREALTDCGVLYISSHGVVLPVKTPDGVERQANIICTEIVVPEDEPGRKAMLADLTATLGSDVRTLMRSVTRKNGETVIGLTPAFFAQQTYANTFVYIDACNSSRDVGPDGMQLRGAFSTRGAAAFIGWDNTIDATFSVRVAEAIFKGLMPPYSGNNPIESISMTAQLFTAVPPNRFMLDVQVNPPVCCWPVTITYGLIGDEFRLQQKPALDGAFNTGFLTGGPSGSRWRVLASTGVADDLQTVLQVVILGQDAIANVVATLPWGENTTLANLDAFLTANATGNFSLVCNPTATGEITVNF